MVLVLGRRLSWLVKRTVQVVGPSRWIGTVPVRRAYLATGAVPSTTFMNLADTHQSSCVVPVFKRAAEFAERIAIRDSYGEYTYRGLLRSALSLADVITEKLRGDVQERVAFLCPNNASYVIVQWACWISGQIGVPLGIGQSDPLLEYLVTDSDSSLVITVPKYRGSIEGVVEKVGCQLHVLDDCYRKNAMIQEPGKTKKSAEECDFDVDDIGRDRTFYSDSDALILYTTGPTGSPKGVVVSHTNLHAQVNVLVRAWEMHRKDCVLHVLPLNHITGIVNMLLCPLSIGARCVMLEKFDTADVWIEMMGAESCRVNMMACVPSMYVRLIEEYDASLRKSERMMEYIRETLKRKMRLMLSGSAPLPRTVFERWEEITGHKLLEVYSMTETGVILGNPLHGERCPDSVGSPLPGVKVKIRPQKNLMMGGFNTQDECIGQLLVKSNTVFNSYWKKPSTTHKQFTEDGWFKTGDIVHYSNGMYAVLGQECTDVIKTGGFNVSALQVESVLRNFEPIKDVAVVGIEDSTWGKKVAALVSLKDPKEELNFEEICDWAKCRLPEYAVPVLFRTVDSIPRDQLGKVNKPQLVHDFFLVQPRNC